MNTCLQQHIKSKPLVYGTRSKWRHQRPPRHKQQQQQQQQNLRASNLKLSYEENLSIWVGQLCERERCISPSIEHDLYVGAILKQRRPATTPFRGWRSWRVSLFTSAWAEKESDKIYNFDVQAGFIPENFYNGLSPPAVKTQCLFECQAFQRLVRSSLTQSITFYLLNWFAISFF
jgi:hypothetical protein